MTNNYIRVVLGEIKRNEFKVDASLELFGNVFSGIEIKIDTGCSYTNIPAQKIGISPKSAEIMKTRDISNDSIKKHISFGVNDSRDKRENDRKLFKAKQYDQLTSVSFVHQVQNLTLDNVNMGDYNVRVNYDRTGNILLGMDILKDWDIHMGMSLVTGENIFMGCPRDRISPEYLQALEIEFGLKGL